MNWTSTPAQRALIASLEEDGDGDEQPSSRQSCRIPDKTLLRFVAQRWRELQRPPTLRELREHRVVIQRRFGIGKARRRAAELLTEAERAAYTWRCPKCGREFTGANGLASHASHAKRRGVEL